MGDEMVSLSDHELLEYNKQGLIPGPQETEEAFAERASYCLHLKSLIPQMLARELPFGLEDLHFSDESLIGGCEKARELYDIYPRWVPIFFSNYKLAFWQGGCAWIFQKSEKTPTSSFFQLRQNFRYSQKYLGIYRPNGVACP